MKDIIIQELAKKRIIVLLIILLVFISFNIITIYQLWNNFDLNNELSQFEITLSKIMNSNGEISKDIKERANKISVKSEGNTLINSKQLVANPFNPILSNILTQKNSNSASQSREASNEDEIVENNKEEVKVEIPIEILGILSTDNDKRAILDIADAKIHIVKVGSAVKGLRVKKITSNTVIITKEDRELVYKLGGDKH